MSKEVEWVAEVFQDWTTLQIIETGQAFAFNRETGGSTRFRTPTARSSSSTSAASCQREAGMADLVRPSCCR